MLFNGLLAANLDLDSSGGLDIAIVHGENGYRDEMGSYLTILFLELVDGSTVIGEPVHYHTCHEPSDMVLLPFDDDEDAVPNIAVSQGFLNDVSERREPAFVALHVHNGSDGASAGYIADIRSGLDTDPGNDDDCGTYPEICEAVGGRRTAAANFNPSTGSGGSNLDLATALIGDKSVAISIGGDPNGSTGDGDGSFTDPPIYLDVDPDDDNRKPRDLSIGDFQNDGNIDIVTANQGTVPGLSIFLNAWVSGTVIDESDFCLHQFDLPESDYEPQSVRMADFTGDGKDDLIVGALKPLWSTGGPPDPPTDMVYKVYFFKWTGGTCTSCTSCLTSHFSYVQGVDLDYSPHDLEVAQLNPGTGSNQDSYLDLAIALRAKTSDNVIVGAQCTDVSASDANKGGIAIIWGQPLSGTNFFDSNVAYLLNSSTTTSEMLDPRNIEIGDFDDDGELDLAVPTHCNSGCSVWHNQGAKSFSFKLHVPVGSWPNSLEASDFDCDGNLDLALSCYDSNNVTVLMNNGTSTWFDEPFHIGVGYENYFMEVGDFDLDGKIDIVTSNADSDDISFVRNLFDCD